jgi:Zn-dependent M28 family amino/carboxypeptidase
MTALAAIVGACDAPDSAVGPRGIPNDVQLVAPQAAIAQTQGYRKAITVEAIRAHQAAFQTIATNNSGIRSSIGASHDATINYIRGQLATSGYDLTVQSFEFAYGGDIAPPVFQRVAPNPTTFTVVTDFSTMTYSGSGDVTAPVHNVDLLIPSNGSSTSGCEASDFAGFPAGAIALIQRGTCEFRIKALNAQAAGASAVIIMNEGNIPSREGPVAGTVNAPSLTLPVIGTSYAIGVALATSVVGPVVRIKTLTATGTASSSNLIAETPGGDPDNVVIIEASADGRFGPAINATSGGAAMIELARVFAAQERSPRNRVRFIWFGAYPEGQHGSTYYLNQLTSDERDHIRAVIDVQPIGSPNYGRFVVDGDQSTFPSLFPSNPAADAASGTIEALFNEYFAASSLAVAPSGGAQNAAPFRVAGIPFGGLTTGFGVAKTAQEAALFGGTAAADFDPCVSLFCDSFANTSTTALDQMSDAAAHVLLLLSKRNFAQNPLGQN